MKFQNAPVSRDHKDKAYRQRTIRVELELDLDVDGAATRLRRTYASMINDALSHFDWKRMGVRDDGKPVSLLTDFVRH
jgi:hypothetical protein